MPVPGPASSVVERSLRNIPSEGTGVRYSPQDVSFQSRLIRNMVDGTSNNADERLSRNLDTGRLSRHLH